MVGHPLGGAVPPRRERAVAIRERRVVPARFGVPEQQEAVHRSSVTVA
jgi:hypothetical protein